MGTKERLEEARRGYEAVRAERDSELDRVRKKYQSRLKRVS